MKSIPLNTTQPADLVEAAQREAKRRGVKLSALVGEGIRRVLPKEERAKLADRPKAGRPWPVKE